MIKIYQKFYLLILYIDKYGQPRWIRYKRSISQQGNSVGITITQSYCGTNSYSDLNGTFVINGNCMSNTSSKYCK